MSTLSDRAGAVATAVGSITVSKAVHRVTVLVGSALVLAAVYLGDNAALLGMDPETAAEVGAWIAVAVTFLRQVKPSAD